jgi:hypothetical protein
VTPGNDRQLRELVHDLLGPSLPDGAVAIPISGHDPAGGMTHLVNLNKEINFLRIRSNVKSMKLTAEEKRFAI